MNLRHVSLCSWLLLFAIWSEAAWAAVDIPITVNLNDAVTVTGTPRIALNVGGTTRYATYSSGSGTSTLVFTYSVQSGDVDADGIALSSPIQLNGGSITDSAGNPAILSYTLPDTSAVLVNAAIPSGYSAAFTSDTVTNSNKTSLAFILTSPKVNRTYHYTITSSGGGAPLTGSGTLTTSPQTISGLNVSGLPDGILTLSVTLSDSLGGSGSAVTDTIPMAVLNANLVGHWTFDANDVSGTTAYDRSGNANNGTLTNGPTTASGVTGNGVVLDGVNDYVLVAKSASLEPAALTLSAWVKFNSLDYSGNAGVLAGFASKGYPDTAAANSGWWFSYDNRLNRSSFSYTCFGNTAGGYVGGGNNFATGAYNSVFTAGNYIHLAVSVNSTQAVLYINGVQKSTARSMTNLALTNAAADLLIGRVSSGFYLGGAIDDFRVYNTVLTPAQIATIYSAH